MKAIALFSGGLDSTLAIKVIQKQGVEVIALNFLTPFCRCLRSKGCSLFLKNTAEQLGVELKMKYLGEEYLEIVRNPKHGYGRNFNPCIDCRILKFKYAKSFMEEIGAAFLISGEVLGQRPMSQHRQALSLIERETGLEGLILRPLSAKLFPPTLAEKKGWVKREALLDISGRSRRPQMQLASQLGIKDYPCPAGGCLLTDSTFSKRLGDLFEHEEYNINTVELLKIGRHFRISSDFKLIVGRNQKENSRLSQFKQKEDIYFEPQELPGPSGLGRGKANRQIKKISAQIIAHYTVAEGYVNIAVSDSSEQKKETFSVGRLNQRRLKELMIH